jgi:hypothetical protein
MRRRVKSEVCGLSSSGAVASDISGTMTRKGYRSLNFADSARWPSARCLASKVRQAKDVQRNSAVHRIWRDRSMRQSPGAQTTVATGSPRPASSRERSGPPRPSRLAGLQTPASKLNLPRAPLGIPLDSGQRRSRSSSALAPYFVLASKNRTWNQRVDIGAPERIKLGTPMLLLFLRFCETAYRIAFALRP